MHPEQECCAHLARVMWEYYEQYIQDSEEKFEFFMGVLINFTAKHLAFMDKAFPGKKRGSHLPIYIEILTETINQIKKDTEELLNRMNKELEIDKKLH